MTGSWPIRLGLFAVAGILAFGVGYLLLGKEDEAGAEVILEPTDTSGADPFTKSVSQSKTPVKSGGVKPVSGGGASIESVTGSSPQLYGGTGNQQVCDAKAMIRFLEQNPDKAAAFAGVVGVAPGQVGKYISRLTPVVLREDTRVTNHGFAAGRATPRQAVLQAGTAVLVDDRGVPRVRCACGNPLAKPKTVSSSGQFKGRRWAGFNGKRLVAVSPSRRKVSKFELVNVKTGKPYEVSAGGGTTENCTYTHQPEGTAEQVTQSLKVKGVSCEEAKQVLGEYADPTVPHAGSGGAANLSSGFFCIHATVGQTDADPSAPSITCTRKRDGAKIDVFDKGAQSSGDGDGDADESCTTTAANGVPVKAVVDRGNLDCAEATEVFKSYFAAPKQGSGGSATVGEWFCISGTSDQSTCDRKSDNARISTKLAGPGSE